MPPRGASAVRGDGDAAARLGQWLTSLVVKLHALRGAITCDEDSKAEIDAKTTRLVKERGIVSRETDGAVTCENYLEPLKARLREAYRLEY